MVIDNFDPANESRMIFELSNLFKNKNKSSKKESNQKQNAILPGLSTPSKLDKEVEEILQSIKPDVMASIKKTAYFEKGNKPEASQ